MEGKFRSNSGLMCWCSSNAYQAIQRDRYDETEAWQDQVAGIEHEAGPLTAGEDFIGLGLASANCRWVGDRAKPMVYLFLAGSESDLGYLAESAALDDFSIIDGVRLDCASGNLVVFDPTGDPSRPLARLNVTNGTYLPYQIRQMGEEGEAWMVVLFEEAFAERTFG